MQRSFNKTVGEKIFDLFNILFFILFSVSILLPFVQQIMISLSSPIGAIKQSLHLWPIEFSLDAYKQIFSSNVIFQSYAFTITKTVIATVLTIAVTCLTAYPLSKRYLPLRKPLTVIMIFTMYFSGGMIPNFLLVSGLGLRNSMWALILPTLFAAFYIIIVRSYFLSIPAELEESAKIDGASDFVILAKIIMPMSVPVLATIAVWTLVNHWNSWFDALLYIRDENKMVLQILLRRIRAEAEASFGTGFSEQLRAFQGTAKANVSATTIRAAILLVVILPIVCTYPFLQKYFVKGIMIGAIKG